MALCLVPGSSPLQNDPSEFTGSWSQMEEQRSLETVESRSPYSQLLIWPDFQGLTPTRWGPGLASLERPHSVLGKLGPLTGGFFAHSHMQVPQRLCSQLPEVRTVAWLQGPWWRHQWGCIDQWHQPAGGSRALQVASLGLNFLGVSQREAQSLKSPSSLLDPCGP